jgi:putative acetyltransferase
LAQLFYDTIHNIAGQHYSAEQVHAWAPTVPSSERFIAWGSDGRLFLVVAGERDEPLAFGDLERDGHIDHLFCRADLAGTGVTSLLYDALEHEARRQKQRLLYVEASEPARRFFSRKGFRMDHRRNILVNGVPIHNYRMEKDL